MRLLSIPCLLAVTVFSLNACKSVMNPSFLPSGYTYHHDIYKAPPAGEPWHIGYDYSRAENAEILSEWADAASDIINRLEASNAIGGSPIFLSSPHIDNAFSLSLDHALREELRARGYYLAATPEEQATKLAISSYDPEFKDKMRSYDLNDATQDDLPEPPQETHKNLVIKVMGLAAQEAEDGTITEQSVTLLEEPYILPLYGYEDEQLYFPLGQKIAEVLR